MTHTVDIKEFLAAHRASLGRRSDSPERMAEARRLTRLLNSGGAFSFGRLGDFDLLFLLAPDNSEEFHGYGIDKISGTEVRGGPGLLASQVERLRDSLERLSYLDFHERLWKDNTPLDQMVLKRRPNTHRNPDHETSYILPTWLAREFKSYCSGKRVLFCGAEAPLLEALMHRDSFREAARDFLPDDCKVTFLRPREDGRNLGANLDLIKADLTAAIKHHQIEVAFLSLGGAAKILCCELAEELGIRAIDFGASLRSLTYSGGAGYTAARSHHIIFLFRVPFEVYMDALEEAYPKLPAEILLAKAHAQLLLEVQDKEVGWTHSAWEYDFGPDNLKHFEEAHLLYRRRYQHLFRHSAATRREREGFLHFCGKHRLTKAGRRYFIAFLMKDGVARLVKGAAAKFSAQAGRRRRPQT